MSITKQMANVTKSAIVVASPRKYPIDESSEFVFGCTKSYIGVSLRLQKSSSEQQAIAVGFRCGTKFPLHCIKPASSGGRQPNDLKIYF